MCYQWDVESVEREKLVRHKYTSASQISHEEDSLNFYSYNLLLSILNN